MQRSTAVWKSTVNFPRRSVVVWRSRVRSALRVTRAPERGAKWSPRTVIGLRRIKTNRGAARGRRAPAAVAPIATAVTPIATDAIVASTTRMCLRTSPPFARPTMDATSLSSSCLLRRATAMDTDPAHGGRGVRDQLTRPGGSLVRSQPRNASPAISRAVGDLLSDVTGLRDRLFLQSDGPEGLLSVVVEIEPDRLSVSQRPDVCGSG